MHRINAPGPRGQPVVPRIARRSFLRGALATTAALVGAGSGGCAVRRGGPAAPRVATFSAEVTVPPGHGMMGGAWVARTIADPLEAHGFVWLPAEPDRLPVVWVTVDWCEIRNDAFRRWQEVLATAAGTTPDRVMVSTVHQHDAPVADLEAEAILRAAGSAGSICDPMFHENAVQRVGRALRASLVAARPVSHVGQGQAKVLQVASNRRYVMPDGQVRFDRTSATRNAFAIAADEGLIDPWLKTLSFWDGEVPLVALHFYAVHPMSYYGQGEVSADYPGLARRQRQAALPGTPQIYASGCSGNVTAGKYNTGARELRPVLAERLRSAMEAAWLITRREPLAGREVRYRTTPLWLEPRADAGFTEADLVAALATEQEPFRRCLRAMGLSWRRRVAAGLPIEVPCLDLGSATLLLLPGESYVEYQLAAQALRPGDFVCVAGYGDGATGYIPTEAHWAERDPNLGDWCWVAPGAEARMLAALRSVLL